MYFKMYVGSYYLNNYCNVDTLLANIIILNFFDTIIEVFTYTHKMEVRIGFIFGKNIISLTPVEWE